MQPPTAPPLEETPIVTPRPSAEQEAIHVHESWNILTLALHHVVLRIAWIFKTESVIMPAFLDAIAGAGWLRGCLPVLNRFGQSVPPMLFAERLRRTPRKKWPLLATALAMAGPFLILAGILFTVSEQRTWWLPAAFLALYALFYVATGLNALCFGTIQGKLVRPDRRGRLLSLSGLVGAGASIACAWFLLPYWLGPSGGGFGSVFAFTGIGFAVSGLLCAAVFEPADPSDNFASPSDGRFQAAWKIVRSHGDFSRLAPVAMMFVTMQLLFPHFQALGRERLGTGSIDLMYWVVAQNAGMGLFSLLIGATADRAGNRLALRLCIVTVMVTPVWALALAAGWVGGGKALFWTVFVLVGMTPVTFRTFINYTLEIAEHDRHPQYISTLKLCMAVPFLASPFVGALVDWVGFDVVFLGVSAMIALSGLLTLRLPEPRYRTESPGSKS